MRAAQASVDDLVARLRAPCLGDFARPASTVFDRSALRRLGLAP
jgi:hypothetical protein